MPIDNIKRAEKYLYNGNIVHIEHKINSLKALVCDNEARELTDNYFEVRISQLKPLNKARTAIKSNGTEINKVSDARKKEDKIYNTLRKVFLENHTECEIKLEGCTKKATEVHHLFSGASRSKYYLVVTEWLAGCRSCHYKAHNVLGKDEAIELGLKKIE